jgi:hypothetical protein
MTPPDCAKDLSPVENRIRDLSDWLRQNGGNFAADQKHLDEGTQERVYWHYGYMVALKDVLRFLMGEQAPNQKSYTQDSSTSHPLT